MGPEPRERRSRDRLSADLSVVARSAKAEALAKEGEIAGSEGQIHRLTRRRASRYGGQASVATSVESVRTVSLIPNDSPVRFYQACGQTRPIWTHNQDSRDTVTANNAPTLHVIPTGTA